MAEPRKSTVMVFDKEMAKKDAKRPQMQHAMTLEELQADDDEEEDAFNDNLDWSAVKPKQVMLQRDLTKDLATLDLGDGMEGEDSGDETYGDWSTIEHLHTGRNYKLQIQVRGAKQLTLPEYRMGDVASMLFSSEAQARLSKVYVKVEVATVGMRTQPRPANECRRVEFEPEIMTFPYNNDTVANIVVKDERWVQARMFGNPIIGTGKLVLDPEIVDCVMRFAKVFLFTKDGTYAGAVILQYALVPAS
eukprot:TRINITY_DN78209_c0_g1_i1.p1 TRINITY_DN78209_c0_g1~~TRINITY_DN78209_c0_g1_i1.p1  ORF type:complete len:248 (+),score=67.05 TRINITY_DN78209_c0_g1_i1:61-804(+)